MPVRFAASYSHRARAVRRTFRIKSLKMFTRYIIRTSGQDDSHKKQMLLNFTTYFRSFLAHLHGIGKEK